MVVVSTRGVNVPPNSATATSGSAVGDASMNAAAVLSRFSEKPDSMASSPPLTRRIAVVTGSTTNRCEAVFCDPPK